jgi:hypothetical protein
MIPTREKRAANRGVDVHILELIKTDPKGFCHKAELLVPVMQEFPLADIKTIGNSLTRLKKKNKIFKAPSLKGVRGVRWCPVKPLEPKPVHVKRDEFNAEELGAAVISIIFSMKKRLKEQNEKVDQLLSTLSNREATWKKKEEEFRNKIMDKNKVIESLQMQLEPDPDLVFKLSEVANFMGDKHDQGKT